MLATVQDTSDRDRLSSGLFLADPDHQPQQHVPDEEIPDSTEYIVVPAHPDDGYLKVKKNCQPSLLLKRQPSPQILTTLLKFRYPDSESAR